MVYLMLFETFCKEAQKRLSLLAFMIKRSDDKLTSLCSKQSSVNIFPLFRYCIFVFFYFLKDILVYRRYNLQAELML